MPAMQRNNTPIQRTDLKVKVPPSHSERIIKSRFARYAFIHAHPTTDKILENSISNYGDTIIVDKEEKDVVLPNNLFGAATYFATNK